MTMEQHSFNKKLKNLSYLICSKCGLIKLNNPFTLWCVGQGCDYSEHPKYQTERAKAANYNKRA